MTKQEPDAPKDDAPEPDDETKAVLSNEELFELRRKLAKEQEEARKETRA